MTSDIFTSTYNPDVLSCLANLSSDEVFTPPNIVNQMLDLLPEELWHDKNIKFLDPACKSGVFLREIAKRLLEGLKDQMPELQKRIDHIFHKQLFGIAITELTSLLSRRSLYCSKYPNGKYSISNFDDSAGNIRFKRIKHRWVNNRCSYCGAAQSQYDRGVELESHAYEFIHITRVEEIFHMKFDVIIGNPPYQLSDGGGGIGTSAKPLYNRFVEQAKKLEPRFLTMIIPARWYVGGKGLNKFRNEMLYDDKIRVLCDFFNAVEVFPGVDISGGVCYFLWDRDNRGDCKIISSRGGKTTEMVRPLMEKNFTSFIRFNEAVSIVKKASAYGEDSFAKDVAARKPFGIPTNVKVELHSFTGRVKIFAYPRNGYVDRRIITKNQSWLEKYKVCTANVYGERGEFPYLVLGKPFVVEPGACSSETYIVLRVCDTIDEAQNIISYIKTRFFRFLTLLIKNTPNATSRVYQFVPVQDFSKQWTDEELNAKYGLTNEEIAFIESMIRPMDLTVSDADGK